MSPTTSRDEEHRPPALSDRDREMAHEIARHTEQRVVARIIDLADDDEFIKRVFGKWRGEAERVVGAAFIRFIMYIVGIVALFVSWKAGVFQAISDIVGSSGGHKP